MLSFFELVPPAFHLVAVLLELGLVVDQVEGEDGVGDLPAQRFYRELLLPPLAIFSLLPR